MYVSKFYYKFFILVMVFSPYVYASCENIADSTDPYAEVYEAARTLRCTFLDVHKNEWYAGYVEEMCKEGIVKGYPDSQFRPENEVNRFEFIKMVISAREKTINSVDLDGENINLKIGSLDCSIGTYDGKQWYCEYFRQADFIKNQKFYTPNGITLDPVLIWSSYENSSDFDKDFFSRPITREEAARVLMNAKGNAGLDPYKHKDVCTDRRNNTESWNNTIEFLDIPRSSDSEDKLKREKPKWVYSACENEIMYGYSNGNFYPDKGLLRGEATKVICETFFACESDGRFHEMNLDEIYFIKYASFYFQGLLIDIEADKERIFDKIDDIVTVTKEALDYMGAAGAATENDYTGLKIEVIKEILKDIVVTTFPKKQGEVVTALIDISFIFLDMYLIDKLKLPLNDKNYAYLAKELERKVKALEPIMGNSSDITNTIKHLVDAAIGYWICTITKSKTDCANAIKAPLKLLADGFGAMSKEYTSSIYISKVNEILIAQEYLTAYYSYGKKSTYETAKLYGLSGSCCEQSDIINTIANDKNYGFLEKLASLGAKFIEQPSTENIENTINLFHERFASKMDKVNKGKSKIGILCPKCRVNIPISDE